MATKGTILVTGGTGYIGSHTTVELIQAGYKVVSLDNLSNSNINVLEGIEAITPPEKKCVDTMPDGSPLYGNDDIPF